MRSFRIAKSALSLSAVFALGLAVGARGAGAAPEAQNPYAVVAQLGRVLVQIENSYVDPVDRARILDGAIKGMVDELDPHSSYLRPDEWKALQSDTDGKFGGVGIEVDTRDGELLVVAPIEGGPAERAGVLAGDRVVQVDGADVRGQALDKVIKRMRGAPGTRVKLTVLRAGKPLTLELTRDIVKVKSVISRLLVGNVAYLRLRQFQTGSHDELVRALSRMRAEGHGSLTGVVLDLRNNPGGLVDEAQEIADEFLSQGGIYSLRRRGQTIEEARARAGGAATDLPVVILVNEWSASASELLAGALQDNQRATVVGAATFGKGSVQSILELPGGTGLKLTTARYFTPAGHAIQADGIHPDVLVESSHTQGPEPVITRERDLENHLPPEGPQGGAPKRAMDAGAPVLAPPEDAGARSLDRLPPENPETGTDFVLRMGYQILRSRNALGPGRR
jgi:carboxyl-terminal processing protease